MQKAPGVDRGLSRGARYWDRTSDLFRVREARYRCANRACQGCCFVRPRSRVEVATGFEPVYTALQAAASPLGHATVWGSSVASHILSFPQHSICMLYAGFAADSHSSG